MPLVEHLRELRRRLFKSVVAMAVATTVAFLFYGQLFDLVIEPFDTIRQQYAAEGATVTLNFQGVGDPFSYALKICALAGLIASSPVWLYQLWAFVTPGLHQHERRWGRCSSPVSSSPTSSCPRASTSSSGSTRGQRRSPTSSASTSTSRS
jgi:sec-independent protein translocase protein TatC